MPNIYTGSTVVSVPLHNIDFDGWQLPLSLTYDTSGIRANQDATEVGLGWVLNATGVITRIIKTNNDLNKGDHFTFPGYVYQTKSPLEFFNNFNNNQGTVEPYYALHLKSFDGEPDDFNYNFFGYAGGFVFNKIENNEIKITHKQKNGVKIEFDESQSSFTIVTPNGYKGIFSIKERSTNYGGKANAGGPYDSSFVDFLEIKNRGNFRVISAWYLKKIISPRGKEINFEYNIDENESSEYVSLSQPTFSEGTNYSFTRTAHEHVYIKSIEIPGEIKVDFSMEDREDVIKNHMFEKQYPVIFKKPRRYTRLNITGLHSASSLLKNITLEQSYFHQEYLEFHSTPYNNGDSNKYQMLRSRLDHVIINDHKYTFEYNEGLKGLPNKSTMGIDHFGYYNGRDDNNWLWKVKHFNAHYIGESKLGFFGLSLIDINDETSDTWKFLSNPEMQVHFQEETRKAKKQYAIAGSLSKVIYPTKGSTSYFYDEIEYVAPGLTDAVNRPAFRGLPYYNNLGAEAVSYKQNGPGNVTEKEGILINSGIVTAGGLRISAIEEKDEKGVIKSKSSYTYENLDGSSSGKLLTPLAYFQSTDDVSNNPSFVYTFFIMSPSHLSASITAQGKRVGYSRVIEKKEDSENNGFKTIYEFNNKPLSNEDILNFQQYTNFISKNGKQKKIRFFDNSNNLVKEVEYKETDIESEIINSVTYSVDDLDNDGKLRFLVLFHY